MSRVTNIQCSSDFSISSLISVTHKLNSIHVDIPKDPFIYSGYWSYPEANLNPNSTEPLNTIIESIFYYILTNNHKLLTMNFEKYVADFIGETYFRITTAPTETLEKYFKILKYTKINHCIYERDILHVDNTNLIMIVYNQEVAQKMRQLRGNE